MSFLSLQHLSENRVRMSNKSSESQSLHVTPPDQSEKCVICELAVADDFKKCKCGKKSHVHCLPRETQQSALEWKCTLCLQSTKSSSKKSSIKSKSSKASVNHQNALLRIEEEKRLKEELLNTKLMELEKIHKNYLDQKYAIEDELCSETSSVLSEDPLKKKDVENWIKDVSSVNEKLDRAAEENAPATINKESVTFFVNKNPKQIACSTLTQHDDLKTLANNNLTRIEPPNQFDKTNSFESELELTASHIAARHSSIKNLPSFSGLVEDWPAFINAYRVSTKVCGFSSYENLIRLNQCLSGKAKDMVKGLLILPATVPRAIETLEMLFGRPETIIASLVSSVRAIKEIEPNDLQAYVTLSNSVDNLCATMEATDMIAYLNNPSLIDDSVNKLPAEAKLSWGVHCENVKDVNLRSFSEWLRKRAYAAIRVTNQSIDSKSSRKQTKATVNVHESTPPNDIRTPRKCRKCGGNCERVRECIQFKNADVVERLAIVQEHNLCLTCLGSHRQRCLSRRLCNIDGCKERHHPLIHQNEIEIVNIRDGHWIF